MFREVDLNGETSLAWDLAFWGLVEDTETWDLQGVYLETDLVLPYPVHAQDQPSQRKDINHNNLRITSWNTKHRDWDLNRLYSRSNLMWRILKVVGRSRRRDETVHREFRSHGDYGYWYLVDH